MKNNFKNKGITLIALIITIIVMLILVAVTIRVAVKGGLFDKAGEAAKKQKQAQVDELMSIDKYMRLITNNLAGTETIWEGNLTGTSGTLTLPISLNDASYIYELDIKSDKYTGPAILNVYSFFNESYIGKMSFDNESNAYVWEVRNLQADSINADNIVNVVYSGSKNNNTDTAILTYNTSNIGSEIEVATIRKTKRQYSPFGEIAIKLRNGQDLTADDIVPCINYALDYGDLGYEQANSNEDIAMYATQINGGQTVTFSNTLERNLLTDIVLHRRDDINTISNIFRDYIMFSFSNTIFTTSNLESDGYTLANGIEENPYLSEFTNKCVGEVIVPFVFIYLDNKGLPDLNEDGRIVNGVFNLDYSIDINSEYTEDNNIAIDLNHAYAVNNYAGLLVRHIANGLSILDKHKDDNMTEEEIALSNEAKDIYTNSINYISMYWYSVFNKYHENNLNNIYTILHNNNITINYAGIRIGYYTYILPFFGYFDDSYNPLNDTEYLNKQGIDPSVLAAFMANNGD